MTHKQRMLSVIQGRPVDRIPWVPRLDLWFRAHKWAGTLPAKYRDATLMEFVEGLGFGFHAVIPDFRDLRSPADDVDRGLGLYNLHCMPFRTVLEGVDRAVRRQEDRTIVEYRTPVGSVTTETLYDRSMRGSGITISHVTRYAFAGPDDYQTLGYIFDHARAEPNHDGYLAAAEAVGDRGLVVAYVSWAASPMHMIQRDLMRLDTFFYELHDRPAEVRRLAGRIGRYYRQVFDVCADCPAEVVLLGTNYDAAIQYPPFFVEHIGPWLGRFAEMLHRRGKYLLTHTDGENDGLLEHYVAAGVDVADSICPAPMTRLSLAQVREAFAGRVTIMGGIPSVALLKESMDDRRFESFLDGFFEQVGSGERLILGVSDTTPPGADLGRLVRIAGRIERFGPAGGADGGGRPT